MFGGMIVVDLWLLIGDICGKLGSELVVVVLIVEGES